MLFSVVLNKIQFTNRVEEKQKHKLLLLFLTRNCYYCNLKIFNWIITIINIILYPKKDNKYNYRIVILFKYLFSLIWSLIKYTVGCARRGILLSLFTLVFVLMIWLFILKFAQIIGEVKVGCPWFGYFDNHKNKFVIDDK